MARSGDLQAPNPHPPPMEKTFGRGPNQAPDAAIGLAEAGYESFCRDLKSHRPLDWIGHSFQWCCHSTSIPVKSRQGRPLDRCIWSKFWFGGWFWGPFASSSFKPSRKLRKANLLIQIFCRAIFSSPEKWNVGIVWNAFPKVWRLCGLCSRVKRPCEVSKIAQRSEASRTLLFF